MRIPTGSTDRYVYFVAVDVTDLKTRETGLTGFTVYGSRNGGAAAAFTTPTVNETDAINMPGVYELLLDEQTSLTAGNDTEELCLHITHNSMSPVTRTVELYRPETTEGNTLDVTATGAGGIDWGNIENKTTVNDLSATDIQLCDTVTTLTGHTAQTGDSFGRLGAAGAGLTALPWNAAWDAEVQSEVADALDVAIPGAPTADSINERIAAIDDKLPTGTISEFDEATDGVDVTSVAGDTTAATNLKNAAQTPILGTCVTGTLSTTQATTNLTFPVDDAMNGRVITFLGNITAALAGQQTDITDSQTSNKMLTFTAVTVSPANNDQFVIH